MIHKKLIILGSVLLLTGGIMLGWILAEKEKIQREASQYHLKYGVDTDDYVKQYEEWLRTPPRERSELPPILEDNGTAMTREQLWQEQQERLKADLGKLATGEMAAHPLADVLYGENWQNELREYKKQNERNEHIMTGSIVCMTMGGSIYAGWLLLWTFRFVKKFSSGPKRLITKVKTRKKVEVESQKQIEDDPEALPQEQKTKEKLIQLDKHTEISGNSDQKIPLKVQGGTKTLERAPNRVKISNGTEKINKLLSDEKTAVIKTTANWGKQRSETKEHTKPLNSAINEFTQQVSAIQSGKQRSETDEQAKPLDSAISELTQQVSAIREYAACQQDRLEKLQDGYDWNIIRTFCLRVIRCIDNLESRINRLGEEDGKAMHLEEIRDELIFALESSGIEQFEPEVNSEYRGQEKFAEAVKDKQESDNPEQAGNIAKVIRPGYQYFINEENVKVVRPAQVKLFA
jgi:molecular chaperone GrpE (heat shock protein)